jgi:predicted nicotinamide N-methyase
MRIASRVKAPDRKYEGHLQFHVDYEVAKSTPSLSSLIIKEDTNLVDGIGGETWEGAMVLAKYILSDLNLSSGVHVIELGAGSGLCGIAAFLMGCKVTVTDAFSDLAEINIKFLKEQLLSSRVPAELVDHLVAMPLSWGSEDGQAEAELVRHSGEADLIIGAEIACLRTRQEKLVETISRLAGPQTLVLITFDDVASSNDGNEAPSSKHEPEFNERMKQKGFCKMVLFTASMEWRKKEATEDSSKAGGTMVDGDMAGTTIDGIYRDLTLSYHSDIPSLALLKPSSSIYKSLLSNKSNSGHHKAVEENASSRDTSAVLSKHLHHVVAYYRPSAARVCARCNRLYFPALSKKSSSSSSSSSGGSSCEPSCRYHKGYFVCRRHPAEIRCSIDGTGDSLGYYGTGEEGR